MLYFWARIMTLYFPLYSLVFLGMLISGVGITATGTLYAGIGLLNGLLLLIVTFDSTDYVI
jgi:hypothetical protein